MSLPPVLFDIAYELGHIFHRTDSSVNRLGPDGDHTVDEREAARLGRHCMTTPSSPLRDRHICRSPLSTDASAVGPAEYAGIDAKL